MKLGGVACLPVRVALKQRKADTRAVIQHPAMALVDPGEHRKRKATIPWRVVSQLQHGYIQPAIRHHADDFRHGAIAGPDHPKPGWLTGDLVAGSMLRGQYQPAADQIAGAELFSPIPQCRNHCDYPVHADR